MESTYASAHAQAHPEKVLKQKTRRRLSSWCHIPPEVFLLILVPQTEWMNISLKSGPFWNISLKASQPHMEAYYLYVCVWGFCWDLEWAWIPSRTNILRILELPWLLCVWKWLLNGDCFSLFAMNAHIYAAEQHTPLNKTSSFSFHLKSSQSMFLPPARVLWILRHS